MAILSINVRPRIKLSIASRSRETFVTGEVKEFSEVRVTGLKSNLNGGSVSADDYSWFKEVYSSLVDGSVISWIKGLVNQVKLLTNRVGLLENNYLLKYVVPVDTAAINLTTDKYGNAFNFVEGDKIRVIIKVVLFTDSNRVNLRINDRSDNIYLWHSTLAPLNYFPPMISNAFNQYSLTDIELIDNEAIITSAHRYSTTTAFSTVVTGATTGLNSGITSLKLYVSSATIPAGTVILIKKR